LARRAINQTGTVNRLANMKQKLSAWSHSYIGALQKHVQRIAAAKSPNGTALRLGRSAVTLGIETLELARIHTHALVTLKLSNGKTGRRRRADNFFAAVNAPIEATHRTPPPAHTESSRLQKTLDQRTAARAASQRKLPVKTIRQQLLKADSVASGKHHHQCLAESLQLQKLLRQLTHQALTAREEDRTRLSHTLQDEIAQMLLGINARLLALKHYDGRNSKGLKNEIASAQQLVLKSARSVRQFARELNATSAQVKRSNRKFV